MYKNIVRILGTCACLFFMTTSYAYTSSDCSTVDSLANQGFVTYHDNCRDYNLDKNITRQEVAAVALKVAETCGTIQNITPVNDYYCQNTFNDVSRYSPNSWACQVVETLANNGIVSTNNASFRPLNNITRNEALVIILDSAGLNAHNGSYDDWRFTNTDAVAWQKPIIQYAFDNGIISSISTFGPNKNAYRKEIFDYAQKALDMCGNGNSSYSNNNYTTTICSVGQYASGNSCYSCATAPWNASYTTRGSCTWTCNSGYYKSGSTCVANNNSNNYYNTQCGAGQYWTNNTCYACLSAPTNSYYTTAGSCDWTCNSGYYKSGSTCVYSGNNNYYGGCSMGQYWSGNTCYTCSGIPANAYYTTTGSCDWTCSNGYYKSGNTCVSNYNNNNNYSCTVGQYWSGNSCYTCNTKPSNSYYTNAGTCDWTCYSGYYNNGGYCTQNTPTCTTGQYLSGNMCLSCTTKPSNAYYTSTGSCDWTCSSGYYKSGNTCVSNYNYNTCSAGQYWSGNSCYSCSSLPYNAYYTTAGSCDWTCNSGYYKSGNTCISNNNYNTYCGIGQYSSGNTCYSCSSLPWNAYYTTIGSCDWTCNSGYYKNGNTCVANNTYGNGTCGSGTCGVGQYCSGNTTYTCNNKPFNSYYTTSGTCDWSCNSGYVLTGNTCTPWY